MRYSKQQNTTLKKLIFSIVLVGFLLLLVPTSLSPNSYHQGSPKKGVARDININEIPPPPTQLSQDIPIAAKKNSTTSLYIKIPILGINAPVESVGLTKQGAVGIPRGFKNAGWYNLGTYPGQIGSAVIVGHFGSQNGQTGVFDKIHALRKGDQIYIENGGKRTTFIVRELQTYRADETDKNIFYSSDEKAHLNLITCEGVWDSATKSYPGRLIVFSDIGEESI